MARGVRAWAAGGLATVRHEVATLDQSRPALRRFGLVVGGVFVGIALVIAWRRGWVLEGLPAWIGTPGLVLALLGAALPGVLRPVFVFWMGLAVVLGAFMTRVILTLVYGLMVVPIALVLRLVGKELLAVRRDPAAPTYWQTRDDDAPVSERLERMY